jgi:hypothetical protein
MTVVPGQIINPNFLSPANFSFALHKLPIFSGLVTKVTLPPLILAAIRSPTPFRPLQIPGHALDYGTVNVEYKVDEDLISYSTISQWMQGAGFPDTFDTYSEMLTNPVGQQKYSDGEIIFLKASKKRNVIVKLTDMFPTNSGGFSMDSSVTDIDYVSSTVSFAFQSFSIEKL